MKDTQRMTYGYGRRYLWAALAFPGLLTVPIFSLAEGSSAPTVAPSDKQLSSSEWIAAGRDKFVHTCSYCHGESGDAGKNRPFRSHQDWDPQDIFDTISDGRTNGANIMPSWKESIPPDEIWKIVAYIRSLSKGS